MDGPPRGLRVAEERQKQVHRCAYPTNDESFMGPQAAPLGLTLIAMELRMYGLKPVPFTAVLLSSFDQFL
jgi:hypothetical protein